ncbi:hypothetical protein TRFO_27385 [Tritrichomonas foetus]|uniref:Uncharacterized protein n=1 Tax=Tritrichomonas foetus TaxID=1144522 RepID=A0A1J4K696_9EUKA|nr:hypothetical protein TRFO_27385 [Tritrichomonas foetus]|eukprot:OHT04997.1 hypothetical protein TRFO_27385 [Tritrichomonas foetus]
MIGIFFIMIKFSLSDRAHSRKNKKINFLYLLEKNNDGDINLSDIKLYLDQSARNARKAQESVLEELKKGSTNLIHFFKNPQIRNLDYNRKERKYQKDIFLKLNQIRFYLKLLTENSVNKSQIRESFKREIHELQTELHSLKQK